MTIEKNNLHEQIDRLIHIVEQLRAPDGCPWDRVQTHQSIASCLLEESAELIEAIETSNDTGMIEELGDLLLQIIFHAQLAQERSSFTLTDVVTTINNKLIRRHPHVFGKVNLNGDIDKLIEQWERIKKMEKSGTDQERKSALDGIAPAMPALMKAQKLFKKASKAMLLLPEELPQNSTQQSHISPNDITPEKLAQQLFRLAAIAHIKNWDAETLLREEIRRCEDKYRLRESQSSISHQNSTEK